MKTKKTITHLNYNDLAFFTGESVINCKWIIAGILKIEDETPKGLPKVKISDKIKVSEVDFKINSSSVLDKKSRFEYLCDFYNAGTTIDNLRILSEHKPFIKAIRFTGKDSVLNDILNKEQLLRLQKTWIFTNTYMPRFLTDGADKFIKKYDWAKPYLESLGIDVNSKMPLEDEQKPSTKGNS